MKLAVMAFVYYRASIYHAAITANARGYVSCHHALPRAYRAVGRQIGHALSPRGLSSLSLPSRRGFRG